MTRALRFLPILLAALMFYAMAPMSSGMELLAGGSVPDAPTVLHTCAQLPEAKAGILLGKIVPCIINTIEKSTEEFSGKVINYFEPLLYSFLTLVVVLFGVKVLQGEREIGPQAFLLIVKVALVIGILQIIPTQIVPSVYGIISDGVEMTTDALVGGNGSFSCDYQKYGDVNTPVVWKQMDCVLGKLYGFATGTGPVPPGQTKPVNMVLGASAVGLLSGFFFGGSVGVAVFFALIGVLWMVVSMVLSVVKAFVNGYLIVCVMLIIAPFFMPLIFLKVTSEYFEKWWKAILGGILLPIIITAYSMFALQVYDAILFKPESLLQKLFVPSIVDKALQNATTPCDFNVTNDPAFKKASGGVTQSEMDKVMKNPFIQNYVMPALSGGNNACGILKTPVFKITDVNSQEFKDGKKAMNKIFRDALQLFIMAFLIGAGVHTMEGNIATLAAGSGMAARAMSAKSQVEKNLAEGVADVKRSLARSFDDGRAKDDPDKQRSGVTGSKFANSIPGAGKSAAGSFLGQVLGNKRG